MVQPSPRPLNLGIRNIRGKYVSDGAARRVNVYVEVMEGEGKSEIHHYVVPGLTQVYSGSGGGCRGLFKIDDANALWIAGTVIYRVDAGFTPSIVGFIAGTRRVYFARNRKASGAETALACAGQRLLYDGASVTPITDSDLPPPNSCDAISGYILYFIDDGRFFWSEINAATDINSLNFAEAEGKPDGMVRGVVIGNVIWLFGSETTEFWGLTDNADAPFARQTGAFLKIGCLAAGSVTPTLEGVAWVANDKTVRHGSDYNGARISTHTVERAIGSLSDPSEINGFSYTHEGHEFLVLNSSSWTLVYDFTTGLWHEEETYGSTRRKYEHAIEFAGRTLVGDRSASKLYVIDKDSYDDADEYLLADIITPPDSAYPNDIEYNALYLDTLPGTGITNAADQEETPRIMVRTSSNGGNTWSNTRYLETGGAGQYTKRVASHNWGTSQEDGYCWNITWPASVRKAITGAFVDAVAIRA